MEFFNYDTPHGMIKRILYKKYLQAYIPMTQKFFRTLIFDGFAGEGIYNGVYPGPRQLEYCGSPLIALRVAIHYFQKKAGIQHGGEFLEATEEECMVYPKERFKEIQQMDQTKIDALKRKNVTMYFTEAKEERFRKLIYNVLKTFRSYRVEFHLEINENSISSISSMDDKFPIVCHLIQSDFQDVPCPTLTEQERCLAFVDPFGYKIKMKKLAEFTGEGKELFFNFMSSFVNRFLRVNGSIIAKLLGIKIPHEVKERGKAAMGKYVEDYVIKRKYLEKFMPDYLKDYYNDNGQKRISKILELFRQRISMKTEHGLNLAFEMKDFGNKVIYHMVYITDHVKGYARMKDTMIRCTQELITQESILPTISDYWIDDMNFDLKLKQSTHEVADVIYQKFVGKRHVSMEEVLSFVTFGTPFVFQKRQLKKLETKSKVLQVTIPFDLDKVNRKKGTFPDRLEDKIHLYFIDRSEIKPPSKKRRHSEKDIRLRKRHKTICDEASDVGRLDKIKEDVQDYIARIRSQTANFKDNLIWNISVIDVEIDMLNTESAVGFVENFEKNITHGGSSKSRFSVVFGINANRDKLRKTLIAFRGLKNVPKLTGLRKVEVAAVGERSLLDIFMDTVFTRQKITMFGIGKRLLLLEPNNTDFTDIHKTVLDRENIEVAYVPYVGDTCYLQPLYRVCIVQTFKDSLCQEFQKWRNGVPDENQRKKPTYQQLVKFVTSAITQAMENTSKDDIYRAFGQCGILQTSALAPDIQSMIDTEGEVQTA